MGKSVLLDTDILVDVSRNQKVAVDFLDALEGEHVFVSILTYAELLIGARNKQEIAAVDKFISAFTMLYPDVSACEFAVDILREYHLGSGTGIIDAFIAAIAVENKLVFYSRNQKHFENIRGLEFRIPY